MSETTSTSNRTDDLRAAYDISALLKEVDELPDTERSLWDHNTRVLIEFCKRLAVPLRALTSTTSPPAGTGDVEKLRAAYAKATQWPWRLSHRCILARSTNPAIEGDDVVVSSAYSDRSHADDDANLAFIFALAEHYCPHVLQPTAPGGATGEVETTDWTNDPAADERWNDGLHFGMAQLCVWLGVEIAAVNWDAATETLEGDVQSVLGNILRRKFGDDFDFEAVVPLNADDSATTPPTPEGLDREAVAQDKYALGRQMRRIVEDAATWEDAAVAFLALHPTPTGDGDVAESHQRSIADAIGYALQLCAAVDLADGPHGEDSLLGVTRLACNRARAALAASKAQGEGWQGIQADEDRIAAWVSDRFGAESLNNPMERADRLLEEAIEMQQAVYHVCATAEAGRERAAALVDHVHSKEPGEPQQEMGGVMTCALALGRRLGVRLDEAAQTELTRIEGLSKAHFDKRHQAKVDAGVAAQHDRAAPPPATNVGT